MIRPSEEPLTSSFFDLADWIEVNADELGFTTVTETGISHALTQRGAPAAQDAVAGAIAVMRRRSLGLGDSYPFAAGRRRLSHRPGKSNDLYRALAGLSVVSHQVLLPSELTSLATAFEEVASEILASTWGSAGRALHFGWPTRAGRPKSFPLAVTWLARRLNLEEGSGYRPPERQDGGADLIAWNRLADGSTADVRLGQCTISRDIDRKARDIDTDLWQTWIEFPRSPTVALVVPHQVAIRTPISESLRKRGFLVLDRTRLVMQWASADIDYGPLDGLFRLVDGSV